MNTAPTRRAVPRVEILTRSEIDLPAPRPTQPLGTVTAITIHHSAEGYAAAARPDVAPSVARAAVHHVRQSHRARGWEDIGYHFLIDGAGRIYQGRGYARAGALGPSMQPAALALGSHVGGRNTGNIGICILGCFDDVCNEPTRYHPSPAAIAAACRLVDALAVAYGVGRVRVVGHRDLAPTACPGDRLYAHLPGIRGPLAR